MRIDAIALAQLACLRTLCEFLAGGAPENTNIEPLDRSWLSEILRIAQESEQGPVSSEQGPELDEDEE